LTDPRRGRRKFEDYVTNEWLPNHVMELTTRESYTCEIHRHVLPWFTGTRMNEVMPGEVRRWIIYLGDNGVKPPTQEKLRNILSAIFTTAFDDGYTFFNPCKGVKTPTVVKRSLTIIVPEKFEVLYEQLPNADAQLLTETEIETVLRWGEPTS
jgi:site-specific recombinase XerD